MSPLISGTSESCPIQPNDYDRQAAVLSGRSHPADPTRQIPPGRSHPADPIRQIPSTASDLGHTIHLLPISLNKAVVGGERPRKGETPEKELWVQQPARGTRTQSVDLRGITPQ